MHRLVVPAALGTALLLSGCSGGSGVALAVLKGLVTDGNGAALAGATIRSGTASGNSGADGRYTLSVSPGANLKVTASRPGRVATFHVVSVAAGQTVPVDFALNPVGQSTALTSLLNTPAVATEPRGAEVHLAANTLVDSNGAAVDSATVAVTTALPSDAKFGASFPGLFVGNKAGADADIESFGFVNIDITSNAGLACNLKPGATADIAIPVAPGADPGTPTIDLWSLDETTGKWSFVVAATRDATGSPTVYRATVTHFSTYNLDSPISQALSFTVTVTDSGGTPLSGAFVAAKSIDQNNGAVWQGYGNTANNGTVFFPSVPAGQVSITALYPPGMVGNAYQYNLNGNAATATIVVYPTVQQTFQVAYLNNGVQTPLPGVMAAVATSLDTVSSPVYARGVTDQNGLVTLTIQDGVPPYQISASTTVGGQSLSINGSYNSIAGLPAVWVLQ
ncbi:MAG: carboxypeptidase regulatory-like domain-containing protein [Armatimonadetes bacterium]|nr:carboxypeptidase regulatory-like domain-containing protein [Armatimonadota bacterium]